MRSYFQKCFILCALLISTQSYAVSEYQAAYQACVGKLTAEKTCQSTIGCLPITDDDKSWISGTCEDRTNALYSKLVQARSEIGYAYTTHVTTDPTTGKTTKTATTPIPKNAAVAQSVQHTTPQEPQAATPEGASDVDLCQSAFQTAQSCCNNPTSCMTSSEQNQYAQLKSNIAQQNLTAQQGTGAQGVTNSCNQMRATGQASSDTNSLLAGVCSEKQFLCNSSCAQLVSKYQTLIANCNGTCASQSVYQSTLDSVTSRQQKCSQFHAQLVDLTGQAVDGYQSSNSGANCMQAASASPQSGGAPADPSQAAQASDPNNCKANPSSSACQQCAQNPSGPGCSPSASAAQSASADKGVASFSQDKASKEPRFDLGSVDTSTPTSIGAVKGATAAEVKTVPNGGGGGLPGGGGSNQPARLDGPARGGGSPGAPGYALDGLDQGLRSGGGYSAPASASADNSGNAGADSGGGARGPASAATLDLREYLPGGSRAGGVNKRSPEINGRFVDIWERISDRIQEKCRLRELLGCE